MSKQTILTLVLFVLVATFAQAKVIYVNKNAPGPTFDGLSWATAYTTVQAGINAAVTGDEVWVAKSSPAAEAYVENITVQAGIALYGGFIGTEVTRNQRDWKVNVTVLDGNKAGSVVALSTVVPIPPIIDGFTVCNGYASRGGGFLIYGDGYFTEGNVIIRNNSIVLNQASRGGGLCVQFTTATITNSIISHNSASYGGGLYSDTGTLILYNSVVTRNMSPKQQGAGITVGGGLLRSTNSTICYNESEGIAVFVGVLELVNSIVAANEGGVIGYLISSKSLFRNNVIHNTYNFSGLPDPSGTNGNINLDPRFVNPPYNDFHILTDSPCIDTGDDSVVAAGQTDLDGQPRIQGAHVDMGAYEFAARTPPYTLSEAVGALKVGAGLLTVPAGDMARMDLDSDNAVTILDAARIARKVAGLEANP